jgi:regulator of sigma E protease
MKGDRILAIDGKGVSSWEDAAKEIHSHPEQPIDIHVQRASAAGTEEKIVALVPKKDPQRGLGLVGISPMIEMIPQTFSASVRMAGDQTYFWTRTTLVYLRDAIVNRKKPELAGPLGIVTIVAKVSKEGLQEMVGLIALISLSLGLFNFFPIPMLDGGHVFLYFIEGITRRPLNQKFVRVANLTGAALLLAVFVFATSQDLSRLNLTRFWK